MAPESHGVDFDLDAAVDAPHSLGALVSPSPVNVYIPLSGKARSHRIVTSTTRAQTQPASGFMQSVMRQHTELDDLDERVMVVNEPKKKITQEEQDAEDEKARKRAMKNLVNSWQERLQLISVITTFFATTEAAMLVNTKPGESDRMGSSALQASNACLLGALVLHVYASVLSFLGAFLLIRYKLKEATREEMIAEGIKLVNSPTANSLIKDIERDVVDVTVQERRSFTSSDDTQMAIRKFVDQVTTTSTEKNKRRASYPLEPPILSKNPHVELVGLFMSNVSTHLLSRTHALCVSLAAVGFVLAIVGIMCYAWDMESLAVSTFASACLGIALVTSMVILVF